MAALIDTPEAANRLARAIASDLSLYNEAKIKEGIENDTFFSVLQDLQLVFLAVLIQGVAKKIYVGGIVFHDENSCRFSWFRAQQCPRSDDVP